MHDSLCCLLQLGACQQPVSLTSGGADGAFHTAASLATLASSGLVRSRLLQGADMRFRRVRCSAHLCTPGLLRPSGLWIPCCKPRAASVGINRPPTPTPSFRLFKLRTHLSCSVPNPHATAPVRCLPGVMMGRLACQLLAAGLLAIATAVTAQPSPSEFDIREWIPAPCLLGACCAFAIAAA